jgi:hypothetical protein
MEQTPFINNPSFTHPLVRSANCSDRGWILRFALIIMVFSSFPYIVGYETQNEAWRFTGFVFGVEDGNSYLGKMLRGADGDWLFRTPYTASNQHGVLMYIPYLFLGKLVAPPDQHDQLIALYHLFRITGGFLAICAVYDFSALFIEDSKIRKWVVVLSTLGGGLGWFLVMLGKQHWLNSLPLDFYSPETFGFLGTYGIAHLPWSRAFFLWGLRAYLIRGGRNQDNNQPICRIGNLHPGILWLLTEIFQPIYGIVFGLIICFHLLIQIFEQINNYVHKFPKDWFTIRNYAVTALIAGLLGLPYLIYNSVAFLFDPFLKIWMQQNRLPKPIICHYLVAYILIIPFVLVGIIRVIQRKFEFGYLLVGWVVFSPIMLMIPISVQRRLVEGLWVALVVLAFIAFERAKDKVFRRSFIVLTLSLPTTLILLIGGTTAVSNPKEPIFRAEDEVATFEFLAKEVKGEDVVVLCAYDTGNALPAWAPVFVIIGHGSESVGIANITPRLIGFYQDVTQDNDRLALLDEFGVDFVFWGPAEREYGSWNPSTAGFLTLVFNRGAYEIYQVLSPLTHSD